MCFTCKIKNITNVSFYKYRLRIWQPSLAPPLLVFVVCVWPLMISIFCLRSLFRPLCRDKWSVSHFVRLVYLRLGKECPDSKNSGVIKTAKSGNFETINYILIWEFLVGFVAILSKKLVIFGTILETTFFCKNCHKKVKNRPITI